MQVLSLTATVHKLMALVIATMPNYISLHVQEVPLAPPPNVDMENDDIEETGPRLQVVIPQIKASRPESMLMAISGSLPTYEGAQDNDKDNIESGDDEEVGGMPALPPPPPSPPGSESEDQEDDIPIIPTTLPPVPDVSVLFPLTEEVPPAVPTSEIPDDLTLAFGEDELHGGPPPAIPTSVPPTEDGDSPSTPTSGSLPPPPPPPPDDSVDVGADSTREGPCPPGYVQLEIELKKRAKGDLGVTVVSSSAPTQELFMIRRIVAAGAAAKDGRLRPGDRLVAVNGKNLTGLNQAAVLQEMNNAPKDCHLTIWRDPNYERDATPLIYSVRGRSGSHSSLPTGSDEEDGILARKKSLSNNNLENSPLATAKKLSLGRGISPRGSPLVQNRLSLANSYTHPKNGSPLSNRWSAGDVTLKGLAGESLDLSPPPISVSPINQSPLSSPSRTPEPVPHPIGVSGIEDDDAVYPTESTPTATLPQPPSTPPPPVPTAPPPTMLRGMKLDMDEVAAAMKEVAGELTSSDEDEEGSQKEEREEAPPTPPQTTPPLTNEEEFDGTVKGASAGEEIRDANDRADNTASVGVEDGVSSEMTVERPKSLGPVPKGQRLESDPFEIEVSKGRLGGLGLMVCENELGMIAVKALSARGPIAKNGNIK